MDADYASTHGMHTSHPVYILPHSYRQLYTLYEFIQLTVTLPEMKYQKYMEQ